MLGVMKTDPSLITLADRLDALAAYVIAEGLNAGYGHPYGLDCWLREAEAGAREELAEETSHG